MTSSISRYGRIQTPVIVACCAVLLGTGLVGGRLVSADKPEPDPGRRLEWGVYQILRSRRYCDHLKRATAKIETSPNYVMFYRDLGRRFPARPIDCIHKTGATPMISLELWNWHDRRRSESYLPRINAGAYDQFFKRWARDARRDGRRVLLRFGFEMNGDWFSWSEDPKAFVAAWRRAQRIFRQEKADNVEWVWSPNIMSVPDKRENDMHLYYPGDEHVDWVSLDGYNFGDHHDRWHKWQSFEEVFAEALADFAKRYASKPMIISEFGSAPGEADQREAWIREAYATIRKFPQVKAVIWFNYDKRREGEHNWRIDATAGSLRAFNETFAAKR